MFMKRLILSPSEDLQAAIDGLPFNEPAEVILQPGTYRQKLRLKQDRLIVTGHSPEDTVLVFGDSAWKYHEDGRLYNTFRTATLTVLGNGVELRNLAVMNDAGDGSAVGQAVALALYGDDALVTGCRISARQDTLFCGPLPEDLTVRYRDFLPESELDPSPRGSHFRDCLVEGDVDFIFGSGTVWFEDCRIRLLEKGYVAAPSTPASVPYGFVFTGCEIANRGKAGEGFLARPWRPHGAALFLDCRFAGSFDPARFADWGKAEYRFFEEPAVLSAFSRGLTREETGRVRAFLEERFTRPEKGQNPK